MDGDYPARCTEPGCPVRYATPPDRPCRMHTGEAAGAPVDNGKSVWAPGPGPERAGDGRL